ncbi:phage tail tape measure protein [Anaerocolumna sp. MB42-C2]|uniref:phage tail tape measure protein n=1 Tax=Anaerocolumna sp. MB42-C2 TaxID=3070997 RepID=UPI0027E1D502|nr:phage tail tape measure protein [Anaerocolumna sp. MB42-C2]WMJ88861.1 phage tail tape measure protein [Anaerocolumna sp. MB42-C2]
MAKRTDYELQIAIGGKVDNSLSKSVSEINGKLDTVGSTVKAVAGIAATAFASIKIKDLFDETTEASKEMQTSMAGVAKVVDGLKDENGKVTKSYYEMKDSILDMSEDLPKTAEDIAAIMEAAGQSNIAKNELAEFTEDATKMGIAFDTTAEQAGDWMAAWRTALKLDQSSVVTLADQINYLGNTTSENALKISDVVTRVGALANTAGISAASVAALSASMTKVAPEVAATGIKNFSLALVSGESATKKQAKTFEELGLEAGKVAKAMQTDSQGTILDVLERINKLDKDKQTSVMKNLFGSESLSSIAPLVANLDNLKEQFNKVGDSALYAGSMEQEYISASSTAANTDILRDNKIKAMQIKIGDTLLPLSTLASETTGNLAKMFGDFAEENAPIINDAVAGISDTFQEFLPNAVYQMKSFAEGGKEFLSGLKPVFDLLDDNPDLIPNFLKSTGGAIVTYKLGKNIGEIVKGVKAAGSPLKLLSTVITNPWALAIGAVAGGVALFAQSISSANKELRAADLASRFGDISLSLEDLDAIAADIIHNDNMGKLSESLSSQESLNTIKDSLDDTMAALKKFNWKVSIGLKLDKEDQSQYISDITNFISESQNLLLEDRYKLNINMELFTDGSETASKIQSKMKTFYDSNYDKISGLGKDLQKAVNEAFSDGLLTIDESKVISDYMQQMADINEQIANAEFEAKMTALGTEYTGTGLTPESFQNLQAELSEQVEKSKQDYTEALASTLQSYKAAYELGEDKGGLSEQEYNDAVSMAKDSYRNQVGELEVKSFHFQYQTILDAYSDEIGKAMPEFEKYLNDTVNESMENVAQDGLWGKMLPVLYDELLDFDGLDKTEKANISALFQNLLPTQESLEQLRANYINNGQSIPEWLSEGLLDSASLGALTGDTDSILKMIGAQIADSPEQVKLTQEAYNNGVNVGQEIVDGMGYKIPELQVTANGILNTVKTELEKGVNADVPVNIKLSGQTTSTSIFQTVFDKANKLAGHKDGGIFDTPHVAWFAEDGPEAAIPLDGSSEAIRLWQMAGQILGMFDLDNEYKSRSISIPNSYQQLVNNTSTDSSVTNAPTITIENHITVESGADLGKVKTAINDSYAQFKSYMSRYDKEITRTSMGGR